MTPRRAAAVARRRCPLKRAGLLEHQLKLLQPLGTSRQAVWVTILLAAIAARVVVLVEPPRPPGDSRIQWLRAVSHTLFADLRDTSEGF